MSEAYCDATGHVFLAAAYRCRCGYSNISHPFAVFTDERQPPEVVPENEGRLERLIRILSRETSMGRAAILALRDELIVARVEQDELRRWLCQAEADNAGDGLCAEPGDPHGDPITHAEQRWGVDEALRLFPPKETP